MSAALPLLVALLEVYAAGDVADCRKSAAADSVAARTAELIPPGATVFVLGDTAYPSATQDALEACYEPTWGTHRATTLAIPGNHDYVAGRTDDFLAYFGSGAAAEGYFARELDGWLVIGLDSHLSGERLDQQYAWLEATLAEYSDTHCTLAMWHTPLFSSGLHRGAGEHMRRFWALLDARGADVVLGGHEHFYEAFEPLDAEGRPVEAGHSLVRRGHRRRPAVWLLEPAVCEPRTDPEARRAAAIARRWRVRLAVHSRGRRGRGCRGSPVPVVGSGK